jgi:hypothetical protein
MYQVTFIKGSSKKKHLTWILLQISTNHSISDSCKHPEGMSLLQRLKQNFSFMCALHLCGMRYQLGFSPPPGQWKDYHAMIILLTKLFTLIANKISDLWLWLISRCMTPAIHTTCAFEENYCISIIEGLWLEICSGGHIIFACML